MFHDLKAEVNTFVASKIGKVDYILHLAAGSHVDRSIDDPMSFVMDNVHPHDIGTILDQKGIAIRTGHHCAQPVMDRFKIPATARASIAFYNTKEEIDKLCEALQEVYRIFN